MMNYHGYVGRVVYEHVIDDRKYRVVKLRNGSLKIVVLSNGPILKVVSMQGF
jgi:hypothetical protein